MIVTRTRLCTRLVILLRYTPRHLLFVTVVLLVLYPYSYSCCCYSVAYVSYYLIILYLQLFLLLLYAPGLYARVFPFTHTLTRSLSDDPGFARPDIGRLFYCADVHETVRLARNRTLSLSFSLSFDSGILSFLYSCYYSLIPVYHPWLLFCSLFHSRSCVVFICIIAVILDYYGLDL